MKWPWQRESTSDKDVDVLLEEANLASPTRGAFRMVVADVFAIRGRGTVATGTIESGSVTVGQTIRVLRGDSELGTTTVTGVEMFRQKRDSAAEGENVGLLLDGELDEGITSGDVLES